MKPTLCFISELLATALLLVGVCGFNHIEELSPAGCWVLIAAACILYIIFIYNVWKMPVSSELSKKTLRIKILYICFMILIAAQIVAVMIIEPANTAIEFKWDVIYIIIQSFCLYLLTYIGLIGMKKQSEKEQKVCHN